MKNNTMPVQHQRFTNWLIKRVTLPNDSESERARMLTALIGGVGSIGVAILWLVIFAVLGYRLPIIIQIIYIFLATGNLLRYLLSKGKVLLINFSFALVYAYAFAIHFSLGGFFKSGFVVIWIMPIPLFSSLVANRRTTIIWSIIIFLSLIAVAPFDSTFSQLAYYVSPTFSLVNAVLNITVLLVLVVSANLYLLAQLDAARERADRLLLNVLPKPIAERLKRHPGTIADSYTEATVLFADIVGFTQMSAHANPVEVVNLLNEIFSDFDKLAAKHDLEKIKTIGDAYMVVGGLPATRADNAQAVMELAIDLLDALKNHRAFDGEPIHVRVGINTGPVVAGVIGQQKFIYDLWGDTVNTASRMEANSMADFIQVTETTYDKLREQYLFEKREPINVKGKGLMTTYLFKGRLAPQDPRQQSFRVVQV